MNRFLVSTFIAMTALAAAPDLAELNRMIARYAPAEIRADASHLAPGDQKALQKLIEAARLVDDLFITQLWSGNAALHKKLEEDQSPLGQARLHYFMLNKGPWSDLDDHAAFLPDVPPKKPAGANFYPEDLTRDEFETWVVRLPRERQEEARGFFSVIRRTQQSKLYSVPYNTAYEDELEKLAALLNEAAALTANKSLKEFFDAARAGVSLERLLRERRGVDETRCAHRHHDRAVLRHTTMSCSATKRRLRHT